MSELTLQVLGFIVASSGLAAVLLFDFPGLVASIAVLVGVLLVGLSTRLRS